MTSAELVGGELGEVQKYLVVQKGCLGDNFEPVRSQQAANWKLRLASISGLAAAEAGTLVSLIGTGPWTDEEKLQLSSAVNQSLLASSGVSGSRRRPNQNLDDIGPYLTAGDLGMLADGSAASLSKLDVLAQRMTNLGLHLPTESTYRNVLAVARSKGLAAEDAKTMYTFVLELKRLVKTKAKKMGACQPHIVAYPAHPSELPQSIFSGAYTEADPPLGGPSGVAMCDSQVALRRSNKLVRLDTNSIMPFQQSASSSSAGNMDPLMAIFSALQQFMPNQQQQKSEGQVKGLTIFKAAANGQSSARTPSMTAPAKPVMPLVDDTLPDASQKASSSGAADPAKAANSAADETVEPMELPSLVGVEEQSELVLKALADRKKANEVKKPAPKPKGKAKAKGKAQAKAKAASAKTVTKTVAKTVAKTGASKVVHTKRCKPEMPDEGAPTIWYEQGKIHTSGKEKCWRVFLRSTDRVDRKVKWGDNPAERWLNCLKAIEKGEW